MESLLVLVGLLIVAGLIWAFVAPIYLLISNNRLARRVEQLEAHLSAADPGFKPSSDPFAIPSSLSGSAEQSRPSASAGVISTSDPQEDAESDAGSAEEKPAAPPGQNYVFTDENKALLKSWLAQNWVSVVAVLSLTFAGIFFVRYGIEHGLLPPGLRVACGLALGAALIFAGERLRRIGGSGPGTLGDLLPGTLCVGGIVSLYSAVLGARLLYDLIGAGMSFAGLAGVAVISVVLGLPHGAFLTIMGIGCAVLAPFVIGGEADDVSGLFYYFALIGFVALITDSVSRTAWVSTLGLGMVYLGASLLYVATPDVELHLLAFGGLISAGTMTIPLQSMRPSFDGGMTFSHFHRRGPAEAAGFPTRLAMGGIVGLIAISVIIAGQSSAAFWAALAALALLMVVLAFWLETPVLDDAAPLVLAAMLGIIALNGYFDLDVAFSFRTAEVGFAESAPHTMLWLTLFGLSLSVVAGWKSATTAQFQNAWAAGAAVFAPGVVVTLALWWAPSAQLPDTTWALHVAAVALVLTFLARQAFGADTDQRFRPSVYALAALNMVAFALSIVLTETALTLAFAALAFSAAWLDRRYDLPLVARLLQVGVVVCGYRLLVDPGVFWALQAPLHEVLLAFLGVTAALFASLRLLQQRDRVHALIVVESAAWSFPGILACVLVYRQLDDGLGNSSGHWALSIYGMIWMISGAVQAHRAKIGTGLQSVRHLLAVVFGGMGGFLLLAALTIRNPLLGGEILGPSPVDSLMVAYALPALLIAVVLYLVEVPVLDLRRAMVALAIANVVAWIGLEIRRLWQGPDLTVPGVVDGDLYTYTVVLMLVGAGLLTWSIKTGSTLLRRSAMAIIGVTIAKVFLIDMSGLDGLIRVAAFLGLGLTLAGLAWLDAVVRQKRGQ
ncbi:MAG: DUF2339 domain-containing protein [Pseudomonadota bacterium]